MGQRLNIEVYNGDTRLANAYYHWSAYTDSALSLTRTAIKALDVIKPTMSPLLVAIRILEATGAGTNDEEMCRISEDNTGRFDNIVFNRSFNRNDGLLSVTDEGMDDTEAWEEERVEIRLDTQTVSFFVYNYYESKEEVAEHYDGDALWVDELSFVEFDFSEIPFDQIDVLEDIINKHSNGIKTTDGVYTWIY